MIDIISQPLPKGAININDANLNSGILVKNQLMVHNATFWHKIVVHNAESLDREYVLKTITDAVHPLDLIPVFYQTDGTTAHFLVRNCGQAIVQLCRQNLIIPIPDKPNKPMKLWIILGFSSTNELKVNVQDNIISVLNKRYNPQTKTLNLDNFYKDPDLTEFCILSQPKIMYFVLHLSKNLNYQTLKLTNNEIKVMNPVHALWGNNHLTSLDLRNNMITNLSELDNLKTLQITELWLDGNPLCEKYDEYTYIQGVKEVCPKIEKLDGVLLGQNGFPAFRRNFLCDNSGLDLVDQFLEHYFTLYDSRNRRVLESLYVKNAMFSLTAQYISGQLSTPSAQLKQYMVISRNLKALADLSRANVFLHTGNSNIVRILDKMPHTEHDPYTFTADLVLHNEQMSILVISGVFKEPSDNLLDSERILGFSRLFVLKALPNGEYCILNDQFNVSNATTAQQVRAFKVTRVPRSNFVSLPPAKTQQEQSEMADALKQISTLNLDWSKKCLEECGYDLKKALKLFVDLYKMDKIPDEAFVQQ